MKSRNLVERGFYPNKSDVIRDAVTKLVLEKQVASMPSTGDSAKEIRAIRRKLSEDVFNIDEINRLK